MLRLLIEAEKRDKEQARGPGMWRSWRRITPTARSYLCSPSYSIRAPVSLCSQGTELGQYVAQLQHAPAHGQDIGQCA